MIADANLAGLTVRAWFEPTALEPGGPGRLVVEAIIPEGAHIEAHEPSEPYLIPTVLEVAAGEGLEAGSVVYPRPHERRFAWSPVALQVLSGTARFEVPVRVTAAAPAGGGRIVAILHYQACTNGACLPPSSLQVEAEAQITEAAAQSA